MISGVQRRIRESPKMLRLTLLKNLFVTVMSVLNEVHESMSQLVTVLHLPRPLTCRGKGGMVVSASVSTAFRPIDPSTPPATYHHDCSSNGPSLHLVWKTTLTPSLPLPRVRLNITVLCYIT